MARICVDALGGDCEAQVVLDGIAAALAADDGLEVLVAGPQDVVVPFCDARERAVPLVCTQVIAMDEHPAEAVRAKRDATIVRGCGAVRSGEADGFFSAGSTGAVFAAASLAVGRLRGIRRPALAVALPGASGRRTVLLDLGANADARPEILVQFAQMGRAYAQVLLGVDEPCVGLLSNGSEDTKGSELALSYHEALREAGGGSWFAGNAEGTDILAGTFDVIVCDGFTGNVALKSLEGTAGYIMDSVKRAVGASRRSALGALLLKPVLASLRDDLSGDAYGGAVLLGLKAPVLIGHGHTSVEAIERGTLACADAARSGLVERIAEHIG